MVDKRILAAVVDFAAVCAEADISDDAILSAVHWARMMDTPEAAKPEKRKKKPEKAYSPPTNVTIKDLKTFTDGMDKVSSRDILTILGIQKQQLTQPYVEAMQHLGFVKVARYDFGDGKRRPGFIRVKENGNGK